GALVNGEPTKDKFPQHPVMNVAVYDAWQFAHWLGGNLPSVEEWNKASGYYEENRGEGPFKIPWQEGEIAGNRVDKGPKDVGTASKDESLFKIRDMAGNGLEWTRDLYNNTNKGTVPLRRKPDNDYVTLRGQRYSAPEPLYFRDLDDKKSRPGAQDY